MENAALEPGGPPETADAAAPERECAKHPGRPGESECVDCGRWFCEQCVFDWEGDAICRTCIRQYRAPKSYTEEIPNPAEEEWKPATLFTFRMFRTILLRPGEFFETMPRGRGIAEPVFFAFSWGVLLMLLSAPSNYLTLVVLAAKSSFFGPVATCMGATDWVDQGFWKYVVSVPAQAMLAVMGLFMVAAVQHVLLYIVGRRSQFELTLRITFFSIVATALAIAPIPLAAMAAAEVYGVVLQVLGFRKVYEIGTIPALFIALFPIILVVLLVVVVGASSVS